MNLQITFELTDTDLDYFRSQFREAQDKLGAMDLHELVQSTRALVDRGLATDPPEFVRRRLTGLGRLVTMLDDETWNMPTDDRDRVVQMLAYFVDPDDLIADNVPVLGLRRVFGLSRFRNATARQPRTDDRCIERGLVSRSARCTAFAHARAQFPAIARMARSHVLLVTL